MVKKKLINANIVNMNQHIGMSKYINYKNMQPMKKDHNKNIIVYYVIQYFFVVNI